MPYYNNLPLIDTSSPQQDNMDAIRRRLRLEKMLGDSLDFHDSIPLSTMTVQSDDYLRTVATNMLYGQDTLDFDLSRSSSLDSFHLSPDSSSSQSSLPSIEVTPPIDGFSFLASSFDANTPSPLITSADFFPDFSDTSSFGFSEESLGGGSDWIQPSFDFSTPQPSVPEPCTWMTPPTSTLPQQQQQQQDWWGDMTLVDSTMDFLNIPGMTGLASLSPLSGFNSSAPSSANTSPFSSAPHSPQLLPSRPLNTSSIPSENGSQKMCSHCKATTTPLWRRDPTTHLTLCNACGLYLQHRHVLRPQALIDADGFDSSEDEYDPNIEYHGPECSHCHTRHTSVWRRSKEGKQVCNACGVYQRLRGKPRPLRLRRNRIKPRTKRTGL